MVTVGTRWRLSVTAIDAVAAPAYVITRPDMSTTSPADMTATEGSTCSYEAFVDVDASGWWTAEVTSGDDTVFLAAYGQSVVLPNARPTIVDVSDYLGTHSYTDAELQDALDAEASDQRARCRTAPTYPDSLFFALVRRAARACAMRRVLLGIVPMTDELSTRIGRWDTESRRYEAPYRKLPIG